MTDIASGIRDRSCNGVFSNGEVTAALDGPDRIQHTAVIIVTGGVGHIFSTGTEWNGRFDIHWTLHPWFLCIKDLHIEGAGGAVAMDIRRDHLNLCGSCGERIDGISVHRMRIGKLRRTAGIRSVSGKFQLG